MPDQDRLRDLAPLLNGSGDSDSEDSFTAPSPTRRVVNVGGASGRRTRLAAVSSGVLFALFILLGFEYAKSGGPNILTPLPTYVRPKPASDHPETTTAAPFPTHPPRILPYQTIPVNLVKYEDIHGNEEFSFSLNESDVMVFLHIQKTGGTTFGKHLVQDIGLNKPCTCYKKDPRRKKNKKKKKKRPRTDLAPLVRDKRAKLRCDCFRPGENNMQNWLFSRYSTGWKCGLHPGWTELTACVDHYLDALEGHATAGARRYFYVSFLRDPVSRFLSELKHVQRGATWRDAKHMCNGRPPTEQELPACYETEDWSEVELEEFMGCESNLAINRQTRMMADLRLVNCYNATGMDKEERDAIMLQSAKDNLMKLSFFGLTEFQLESQYIFQSTFNMQFTVRFEQFDHVHAASTSEQLTPATLERIRRLNSLDDELYRFAKNVLQKRLAELKEEDPAYEEHFAAMGRKKIVPFGEEYDEDEEDYSTRT